MPENKIDISDKVMSLINEGKLKMKPKWHFVAGYVAMLGGLVGLTILSTFFISLVTFSLRSHGPMGVLRYREILSSFPWMALVVSVVGICLGVYFLKKFDFSYRKNFALIIISFVSSILIAGWLINYSGLDSLWMKRGPMKGLYNRYNGGHLMGPYHKNPGDFSIKLKWKS